MWTLNRSILSIFLLLSSYSDGQVAWTWTPLSDMQEKVANNAVAEGEFGGNKYIYSFGGIDTTKIWSGVHKRAFRYNISNDLWEELDTLPIDLPVIAAAASTVKNKIYIIGGYHVEQSGNEISTSEVVIYDPVSDTYLANGSNTIQPIDDQAQCVYKDSLIYVISGWSNTGNTLLVQLYNPSLDQWTQATSVPSSTNYRVFGSSAQIIGDTIFYYGGATTQFDFPASKKLRKGIIDPVDPTQITWSIEDDAPNDNYRSACLKHGNNIFWVGGSSISYNYDGIAYNGSGGVSPSYTIARYDALSQNWNEGTGAPYGVMDLRGSGQISNTEWIVCGGMEDGQAVSDKTYKLTYDPVTGGLHQYKNEKTHFHLEGQQILFDSAVEHVNLLSLDGKRVQKITSGVLHNHPPGIYLLEYSVGGIIYHERLFLNNF